MARHPAGRSKDVQALDGTSQYVVRDGDTLWDIAHHVLNSNDPVRVARYWPKLHRLNRGTIGSDPNLLQVGQILQLPVERK